MIVLCSIVTFIFLCVYLLYQKVIKNFLYWKKRKVPNATPLPFFGNYLDFILMKKHVAHVVHNIYKKFSNDPYIGVFYGTDPALIIRDPNIIKLVLTKDFYYFHHRESSMHTNKEQLTQSMFFEGGDKWKVLRQNLTSMFSSAKLKNMFYLIENCAKSLDNVLDHELKMNKAIEIKSILARYTMDCIGTCAFGVNTGTLDKHSKTNPFSEIANQAIDTSTSGGLKNILRAMWPSIFYALRLKIFPDTVYNFFKTLLTDVFRQRNNNKTPRNDFIDYLMAWKNNKTLVGDSIHNFRINENNKVQLEIHDDLLISQCLLIFLAGFETTSSTTSFLLFELSKHPEIQDRVIEEVDSYFKRHDGKIEFECINEMPFVQACVDETLRQYPVLSLITREVTEEYTLPTGLRLDKGLRIHIPVYDLHSDPQYFPEPEKFRPERFYGEEKNKVQPYTYIPFGEGPRICIGLRFARMPIYAAVLTIFRKYRVELCTTMEKDLSFEPKTILLQPLGGINLKFIPR